MTDYLETIRLTRVMEELPRPESFIVDNFFGDRITMTEQKFAIEDVLDRHDKLAPFVHPQNLPVRMTLRGTEVKEYAPAYIQFEHELNPHDYQSRTVGEAIGGSLSPEARLLKDKARIQKAHKALLENRLEWMGMKTLLDGGYTIENSAAKDKAKDTPDGIDFGREAVLEPAALTGDNRWYIASSNSAGSTSDVLKDIQDMLDTGARETGAKYNVMLCGKNALRGLLKNQDFVDLMNKDYRNGETSNFILAPRPRHGAMLHGRFNNELEVWTYDNTYYDDATDARVSYMDDNKVIFIDTTQFMGGVAFGFIQDFNIMAATEVFTRSYMTTPPKEREVIFSQSAPLVFPGRINATAVMEVAG